MKSTLLDAVPKQQRSSSTDPFREFHPVLWSPQAGNNSPETMIYSIKRNHGVQGTYHLHNPNDAINDNRPLAEKIIVEYCINDSCYILFTVADLLDAPYPFDQQSEGNILGEIGERIARRVTKYFLKHISKRGYTGGIFDERFDPQHREDFIIAHTDEFILKIQKYPNLIILRRTGRGKYGYENIKELDGFFDYRYSGKRHILVLESKLEKINIDCNDLIGNLFQPLQKLFPEARFCYVLFTDRHSIYVRNNYKRWRQIKQLPANISEQLSGYGIGSLFFTFNETREDFEKIKNFLILQYRALRKQSLTLYGKTLISEKELVIFDGGETPHIKLVKDPESGLWRQIPLKHKKERVENIFPLQRGVPQGRVKRAVDELGR
ncbi:MAG: hypothetical protein JW913_07300 [Chitinispirillaceae bacterium]|nr:hypothetical protein [Chitinispirillaceae bacterium]